MKRTIPAEKKPSENEPSKRTERHDAQQPTDSSALLDKRPTKVQKTTSHEPSPEMKALRQRMKRDVAAYREHIVTSGIYTDDNYQYRHVTLPKQIAAYLPDPKLSILLKESEYRRLGIELSRGWEHYMIYMPEPNILLLRRTHEVAREVKKERDEYLAQKKKEEEAAKRAKAGSEAAPAPAPSGKDAPEASTTTTLLAPERTSTRRKATTTTTAIKDQQKTTKDQV